MTIVKKEDDEKKEDRKLGDAPKAGKPPIHPIFTWSWYHLPAPLGGYIVLPNHVPLPGDPIVFPAPPVPVEPPTAEQIPPEEEPRPENVQKVKK